MKKYFIATALSTLAILCTLDAQAYTQEKPSATNETAETETSMELVLPVHNSDDKGLGDVTLIEGKNGLVARIELQELPQGWHAIHLHEKADCADAFKAAGGHEAGKTDNEYGKNHGYLNGSMHAGDMPNIWVSDSGIVKVDYFLNGLMLKDLQDDDGFAVIIHEKADDYKSQPSGDAGERIACGASK